MGISRAQYERALRKMENPDERDEQVSLVNELRSNGFFVFAVPNGGKRDLVTAKRLKDEGATAGIPDLQIVLDGGRVIWIELKKRKGGRVSPAQKEIHERLISLGHTVIIGYGAKDAMEKMKIALDSYGSRIECGFGLLKEELC